MGTLLLAIVLFFAGVLTFRFFGVAMYESSDSAEDDDSLVASDSLLAVHTGQNQSPRGTRFSGAGAGRGLLHV